MNLKAFDKLTWVVLITAVLGIVAKDITIELMMLTAAILFTGARISTALEALNRRDKSTEQKNEGPVA
jgi:hypothetical protein